LRGNCRRQLIVYCGCSRALGLSDGPLVTPDPVPRRRADRLLHIPAHTTQLTSAGRGVCTSTLWVPCAALNAVSRLGSVGTSGSWFPELCHQGSDSLNCVIRQLVP
jgi:hypothetical protein